MDVILLELQRGHLSGGTSGRSCVITTSAHRSQRQPAMGDSLWISTAPRMPERYCSAMPRPGRAFQKPHPQEPTFGPLPFGQAGLAHTCRPQAAGWLRSMKSSPSTHSVRAAGDVARGRRHGGCSYPWRLLLQDAVDLSGCLHRHPPAWSRSKRQLGDQWRFWGRYPSGTPV